MKTDRPSNWRAHMRLYRPSNNHRLIEFTNRTGSRWPFDRVVMRFANRPPRPCRSLKLLFQKLGVCSLLPLMTRLRGMQPPNSTNEEEASRGCIIFSLFDVYVTCVIPAYMDFPLFIFNYSFRQTGIPVSDCFHTTRWYSRHVWTDAVRELRNCLEFQDLRFRGDKTGGSYTGRFI